MFSKHVWVIALILILLKNSSKCELYTVITLSDMFRQTKNVALDSFPRCNFNIEIERDCLKNAATETERISQWICSCE